MSAVIHYAEGAHDQPLQEWRLMQGTMASDEGPSGTDLPEAGGYWAGRVPGVPVAHPADKSNR